jgi:gamma-glutamyltranspeptidase
MVLAADGSLEMTLATPGTAGQTCTLAQVLARLLAAGQAPEEAIAAPRWSVDLAGAPILEEDAPAPLRAALPEARPMPRGWITFGSVKLCRREEGGLAAFADDRRTAAAGGLA